MKKFLLFAGIASLALLHPVQAEDAPIVEEDEVTSSTEAEPREIEEQAIEWIVAFEQENSEEIAAAFEELVAGELLKLKICEQLAAQSYVVELRALRKLPLEQRRAARAKLRSIFLSAIRECQGKLDPK